ncbi:MAG: hypothetical protein ACYCPT_01860 [Acidimicrobiales bacterium]
MFDCPICKHARLCRSTDEAMIVGISLVLGYLRETGAAENKLRADFNMSLCDEHRKYGETVARKWTQIRRGLLLA